MNGSNYNYKFGEQPSLEHMRKTLTLGGLGFWRLVRVADDSFIFDPQDSLLTILGVEPAYMYTGTQQEASPLFLEKFLEDFFYPKDMEGFKTIMLDCFSGHTESFDFEQRGRLPGVGKEWWGRIFGNVEQRDSHGQVVVISGFLQNISEQYEVKAKLEATLIEKNEAGERTHFMLDTMPMSCDFWEITLSQSDTEPEVSANLIDVNTACIKFFGMPDKQCYLDNFYLFSPKLQPNGRLSEEMALDLIGIAINEGIVTVDWMHQTFEGEPLPCEVTLIKVPYGDKIAVVGYSRDLRELKNAQAELDVALEEARIANEQTRLMLDSMPMICDFWTTKPHRLSSDQIKIPLSDRPGQYLYLQDINLAGMELFSVPDKESYFKYFYKLSPEFQPNGRSSEELSVEYMNTAIREGINIFEWMHLQSDGTALPCEITLTRVPFGENEDINVVGFGRDLRALKAAQAELDVALEEKKATDERIRIMLDTLPIVCNFWDTNPDNPDSIKTMIPLPCLPGKEACLIETNQAAMTLYDLPDKQAYLDNFDKLIPEFQPDGTPSFSVVVEKINKIFLDGSIQVFEFMNQKLDGTPLPCEVTLIRASCGDDFTMVSYTRDMRELKAVQSAMLTERLQLKKIMDSSPICFTITVNDLIKFITPFAQQFTGLKIGDNIGDLYGNAAAYRSLKKKQSQYKLITWHAVKIKRADGEIRSMLLNSFRTDYYGETGIMNWFTDVTKMRQKNNELHQARKAAEESTRAKSHFLANMSHEIRTPMNAILGLLHLLMQSELNKAQREYLSKTENAAKALLRIINDILDFSKMEAGKLEMENENFHLNDVLRNMLDLAGFCINDRGLECVIDIEPETPNGLVGDQIRLLQILNNLFSNAMKFTERGQIILKVEAVSETPTEVVLRFLMQDTGIGLSKNQADTLFSAFTQADASTTRRYGGTGLGLVICKRLVEMMGGTIWVESELGHGSTFGFTAKFGLHQKLPNPRHGLTNNFQGLSALVIDDNQVALDFLCLFLKSVGFVAETVNSGQGALNLMADWNQQGKYFDLVFIDWKMPDMDGIETAYRINQLIAPAELPVIIMATAYNRDEVKGLLKGTGIRQVMTKPLSPSTIVNVLIDIFGDNISLENVSEAKTNKAQEQLMVKDYIGARILLTEDNEVNQLVASRILMNAGLKVDIANNGLEAVEMVKTGKYELVLMDIQMPEMDGMTATRTIRAIPEFKTLPILAMTAHAMSGDREMCLKAGMNGHISKPINLQELFSTLAQWLKRALPGV